MKIFLILFLCGIVSFFLFPSSVLSAENALLLRADINNDLYVGLADFNILVAEFGRSGAGSPADINEDGSVGLADFNILVRYFGQTIQATPFTTSNFVMIYDGKLRSDNSTLRGFSSYEFYVDIQPTQEGQRAIEPPVELEVFRILRGASTKVGTLNVSPAGRYGTNINDNILTFDEGRFLDEPVPIRFELRYGSQVLNTINITMEKSKSRQGLGTAYVTVYSNTSGPTKLDRVTITGADIFIYKRNETTPIYTAKSKAAGSVELLDIEPGLYDIQATYKGINTQHFPIEVTANNILGQSVIVPIEPSRVTTIPGRISGVIQKHEVSFFGSPPADNIQVTLFQADGLLSRTIVKEIGKTTTSEYGEYTFENVPGNAHYFIDFEPYQGWKTLYPKERYLRSQPLYAGGDLTFWHLIREE